jgi:hypothetical protein
MVLAVDGPVEASATGMGWRTNEKPCSMIKNKMIICFIFII